MQSVIGAFLFAVITSTAAPPDCPAVIGRVGCCRDAPQLLTRLDEPYRKVAERKHLHGVAIIELIIDTTGRVCAARVLRGLDAEFDRAALIALRQWTFRPALNYSGKPVTVAFSVTAKAK